MLNRARLRPASRGDPSLLVFTLTEYASSIADEMEIYAVPLEFRQGGMLLAVPPGSCRWSDRVRRDVVWSKFDF